MVETGLSQKSWIIKNFELLTNYKRMEEEVKSRDKNTLKDYFALGEVFGYFFRKKDPNRPTNFSIRSMHVINKISISIFLVGIIYLIAKNLF